jgi:hypothetical protein
MYSGFKRAAGVMPSILKAVLWELDRLARPGRKGNGCGASIAIDAAIIAAARAFVQALLEEVPYRPQVVPTASGKLQLVWYHGRQTLELQFESPQTLSFSRSDGHAVVEEEGTFAAADVDCAVALVQGFRNGPSQTVFPAPELPVVRRLECVVRGL